MAIPQFSTTFNIVTKKFEFTDLNTNSATVADITGTFKITDPNGNVIYNNTNVLPDVTGIITNKELTSNIAILTTSVAHGLVAGQQLTVAGVDATFNGNYILTTGTVGTTLKYAKVAADVASVASGGTFTSTKYDIDGVIDSSLENILSIDLPLNSDGTIVSGNYTIVYKQYVSGTEVTPNASNVYNFNYTSPVIAISQVVDCLTPRFTTSDITNYIVNTVMPTIVRVHTLNYPLNTSNIPVAPAVTGGQTFSAPFYSGTQTTTIESTLTYVFPDGLIVSDYVTGRKEILVDCTFVCKIYCCLRSLLVRKENARGVNWALFNEYSSTLGQILDLVEMIKMAQSCGKSQDINGYTATIQVLADCTEDCTCNDGEPRLVVGLGGGGTEGAISILGTAPITAVFNSGTSTWTIALNPDTVNLINSIDHAVVIADDTTITVTPITLGNTTTYKVKTTSATQNISEFIANIQYTVGNIDPITITVATKRGLNMATTIPVVASIPLSGAVGGAVWDNQNNLFKLDGFQVTPNDNFKIVASVINSEYLQSLGYNGNFEVVFVKTNGTFTPVAGEIYFKLLFNGLPVSNNYLGQQSDDAATASLSSLIKIHFKISE